jgi:hypothetical protein
MGNRPSRNLFEGLGFTERLTRHPRIAYYIYPDGLCGMAAGRKKSEWTIVVPFVVDQLLVGSELANDPKFRKQLERFGGPTGAHVFDPHRTTFGEKDNVEVWRLHGEHASGKHKNADVAEAVWALRQQIPDDMSSAMVAPNHVLVPPGRMHECPWGPPEPGDPISFPARRTPSVEVVVIDSGFIMDSPISADLSTVSFGEWLVEVPGTAAPVYEWQPGTEVPPGVADPRDQNDDGALDALAGHANFVAGVVARSCAYAELTVESLNSSVIDADTSIPGFVTEAEVARCWWEHIDAPVLNVGFAFATLPSQPLHVESDPSVVNGPPSWTLQRVMDMIGDSAEHVIVAPAGNQSCIVRQYPAAFSLTHRNVAGVGSVDANGNRSDFSNYGPWVNCCTGGEDVASALVDWDGTTEEGEPTPLLPEVDWPHPDKTFTGFATWNGTSFAAPRVSAAIAELVAESIVAGAEITPGDAWEQLRAGGPTPGLEMGKRLGLPPVSA